MWAYCLIDPTIKDCLGRFGRCAYWFRNKDKAVEFASKLSKAYPERQELRVHRISVMDCNPNSVFVYRWSNLHPVDYVFDLSEECLRGLKIRHYFKLIPCPHK